MMRLIKRTFLLLLPLFFTLNVNAYEGTPEEQVAAFFEDYATGDIQKSFDNLISKSPKKEVLELRLSLNGSIEILESISVDKEDGHGRYLTHENASIEQISPSVVRIVEFAKYEQHPVGFEFYFYKPQDKWVLSQVLFNDLFRGFERHK